MACVYIPVQNTSEEVRVYLEQLPRDATDILDILKAEQAPLNLWLTFAVLNFLSCSCCILIRAARFLNVLVSRHSIQCVSRSIYLGFTGDSMGWC